MSPLRKQFVLTQFDNDSNGYLSKHLTPEKERERDRVLELIDNKTRYERILDLGCGPGTISPELLSISNQVWGIDISENMIKIASDRFNDSKYKSRIHFFVGEAENLKFPDQFFDVVICLGVLRYLDSWETGLKEIYRVLKPNGIAVISFYYRYSMQWFSMCFIYRPLLPLVTVFKKRSFSNLILKLRAEPLPISFRKLIKVFINMGFVHTNTMHSGFEMFPFNRLFPKISKCVYMKTEKLYHNSNSIGWLGSICIVKGVKRELLSKKDYS